MFVNMYFSNQRQAQQPVPPQRAPAVEEAVEEYYDEDAEKQSSYDETFYVIENEYQQLVFSSRGGALVEVNLPFQDDDNDKSVVKEIEFDREILKKFPEDARFPLRRSYSPGASAQGPYSEKLPSESGYLPLLRRPLYDNGDLARTSPEYSCCNVVSRYPELASLQYTVKHFDATSIVFEGVQNHRKITKKYSFSAEAPYCVDVTIDIEGNSKGLWLTSGIPEAELISGSGAPTLQYRITRNTKSDVEKASLPKDETTISSLYPDWLCNSNGFFGIIVDPLTEVGPGYKARRIDGFALPTRLTKLGKDTNKYKAKSFPGYSMLLPLPSNAGTTKLRFFMGPLSDALLKDIDKTFTDESSGYSPDYKSCKTFHGMLSFISAPFSKVLLIFMNIFHSFTGSWGFSIILLTVLLRVGLYPLNAWSMKSMHRMKEIAPLVSEIQARYKKDPKKIQLETMKLYKAKKVNPISGCFPLLIQMPFLIGMFNLLKNAFVLRGAPFIPGWIDNLTSPDVLFSWETPIIFFGTSFHILPVLLGFAMYLQQKFMSTAPKDKSLLTDQQKQQAMMGKFMTIFFTFMFYNLPSGLNIYWMSSMTLSALQQWLTNKRLDKVVVPAVEVLDAPDKKRHRKR